MRRVAVHAVNIVAAAPAGVAAFAIDQPRIGDILVGQGLEVTGWVIGEHAAVQGVRTEAFGSISRLYPLDQPRPDVAKAYPRYAYAARSGFVVWASVDAMATRSQISIQAALAEGESTALADITVAALLPTECESHVREFPVTAPDFVIIGAQRGGTTSLHAWLSAHPQVKTPATKELHYLTDRYERGRDWYLGQFPLPRIGGEVAGEATPYALFHPLAPQRLRDIAPRAKLIALLRNPADRAYSQYLLERSRGFEVLDFEAALAAEPGRLAGQEERLTKDPTYVSESHKHFSYLARGDYGSQLERWLAHFPGQQLLVLRSEDFYAYPAQTLARVTAFLGISPDLDLPFAVHNRSAGPALDPAIRVRLTDYFAPRNARLAELLGWDPGWN